MRILFLLYDNERLVERAPISLYENTHFRAYQPP